MKQRWLVSNGADLGESIAEIRLAHGLTQQQLAEKVGVERTRLAKLERGRTTIMVDLLVRVLRTMGATLVVEFDDDPTTLGASGESTGAAGRRG